MNQYLKSSSLEKETSGAIVSRGNTSIETDYATGENEVLSAEDLLKASGIEYKVALECGKFGKFSKWGNWPH